MYLIDKLADKPLDYLHISLNDFHRVSMSDSFKDHSILKYVHKKINGYIPFIGVGDVRTRTDAEDVLTHSEIVAVGRALVIDPHWTNKVLNEQEQLMNYPDSIART